LTLFTLILAAGAALMARAASVWQATLFFSLAGLGNAACWVPVAALVQRWVPAQRKGIALSVVTMGVGFGVPLWSLVLPLVVARFGWQAGWLCLGGFGAAVALLNGILVRNSPAQERSVLLSEPNPLPSQTPYLHLFRDPKLWIVGSAYLFVGFNVLVPFTFMGVYAREGLHFSYAVSTRFVALITLFGIVSQLVLGAWSDRVGRIPIMMICGSLMGLGCLAMTLFQDLGALYGAAMLYGLGYGAVWPMYGTAASDFFPKGNTAGVVGIWTVFLGLGSIASPVLCGYIIDVTGGYRGVFLLGLATGALSAILLLPMLKKPVLIQPE
ncbi:MAG: MFS transporter, partial [Desulfobacterales bacterium]